MQVNYRKDPIYSNKSAIYQYDLKYGPHVFLYQQKTAYILNTTGLNVKIILKNKNAD